MIQSLKLIPHRLFASRLSRNFLWAFSGNTFYAVSLFGILIVLAKFGNASMVGKYSLALAVSAPVFMLMNIGLRPIITTDVENKFTLSQYLLLRIACSSFGCLIICLILFLIDWPVNTKKIILLVACAKFFESISNLIHGYFQKHERNDLISKSLALRGFFSLIVLLFFLKIDGALVTALAAMAAVWCGLTIGFDFYYCVKLFRKIERNTKLTGLSCSTAWQILKISYSVGLVSLFVSLRSNIPRFYIEQNWGEAVLGYFSALAYAVTGCVMISEALGQSAAPRLAASFHISMTGYRELLGKLLSAAVLIGISIILISAFFGEFILHLLYTGEYSKYSSILVILSVAGALSMSGSIFHYAMISAEIYKFPGILHFFMVIAVTLLSSVLIPEYGLKGAAIALTGAALIHVLGGAACILTVIYPKAGKKSCC